MKSESSLPDHSREAIDDLPPSAKLVFKTLQYEGKLTQKELVAETRLVPRTIRYAIKRLEERDIITSDIKFSDARQNLYSLSSGSSEESEDTDLQ